MIFLLRYWKHAIALSCALALIVLFGLWRFEVAETKDLKGEIEGLERYLKEATAEVDQCNADKVLTERVSNDYQKSIANLRRDIDRLRRNPHCVPTKPSGPSGVSSGAGSELSSGNGIRAEWLYDFAGRAEQDRLTAKGCLDFMDQLYKSRGYND